MKLLDFKTTEKLLQEYKIPLIETKIVQSKKEAIIFAEKFGYPIVLKIFSSDVIHRTERGFIKSEIRNKKELEISFLELFKKKKSVKDSILLLQKKGEGIELICGMKRDPVFGPVLIFGLGGVFVELFKKVSFGIAPLSKKEAREMIKEIKVFEISKKRGLLPKKSLNYGPNFGVDDILVKLSKIAEEYPEIKEIDFNPIFVSKRKTAVVDAKFLI